MALGAVVMGPHSTRHTCPKRGGLARHCPQRHARLGQDPIAGTWQVLRAQQSRPPHALRAVVLDAGLAATLDAAGFFSKKSAMEAWVVGFVFLASLMYASLSSSSLSMLVGEKDFDIIVHH